MDEVYILLSGHFQSRMAAKRIEESLSFPPSNMHRIQMNQ